MASNLSPAPSTVADQMNPLSKGGDFSGPDDIRRRLLSVALPYAESLQSRAGLVGILLYGSLVRGDVTPLSDIDLAIFHEGEPPCKIEHRKRGGVKVDLIAFPLADVTNLLEPLPRSLDVGFFFSHVLKSLLLAGDDGILYDPTGELRRVKTRLNEAVSYNTLNRVSMSDGYHHFYRPNIEEARSLLEKGEPLAALEKAQWCGWALSLLLKEHALSKETREAAKRVGIPAFADKAEALASFAAVPDAAVEAVWTASRSFWNYTIQAAAEPLKENLRAQSVADPDRLELNGEYGLFWPGEYLSELGRTMDEVNDSLRRSRYDLDHGKGAASLRHLFGCRGSQAVRCRWESLSTALKATGYDASPIIELMLKSEEFTRLGEDLDHALQAAERKEATPEAARQALERVGEMEGLLTGVIPFMSAEELAEWKANSG